MLCIPMERSVGIDCGRCTASLSALMLTVSRHLCSLSISCLFAVCSIPFLEAIRLRSSRLWQRAFNSVESISETEGQISEPSSVMLFKMSAGKKCSRVVTLTGRFAREAWKAMVDVDQFWERRQAARMVSQYRRNDHGTRRNEIDKT